MSMHKVVNRLVKTWVKMGFLVSTLYYLLTLSVVISRFLNLSVDGIGRKSCTLYISPRSDQLRAPSTGVKSWTCHQRLLYGESPAAAN